MKKLTTHAVAWWPAVLLGTVVSWGPARAQDASVPGPAPAAPTAPSPPSVLVMPIEPLNGATRDLAVQVTAVLVNEAGGLEQFNVRSFRELEGALTQEQLKQAAGCDSAGCAAELAGALDTDQIVIGTLGKIGQSYLLTLSRVTAVGARTAGRAVARVPLKDEEALINDMATTVRTLFGVPAPAPVQAAVAAPTPTTATTEKAPLEKAPAEKAPTEKAAWDDDGDEPARRTKTPAEKSGGKSVGKSLGDAFGALVSKGTSLMGTSRGSRTLKSANGAQSFSWISEGRVMVGCPKGETCAKDDAKPHIAETRGFWINKTEVTVKSYEACVAAGACPAAAGARAKVKACNLGQKRPAHPVNCVNFEEAQKYCEWEGGRLPTSDEWEFAAKGGRPVVFPWGNDPLGALKANTCDKQCSAYKMPKKADKALDDGFELTAPVGNFPQGATSSGIQDMAGNVREWSFTEDKGKRHELLGGSYASPAAQVTTWARGRSAPVKWDPTTGFRCIRLTPRPGSDSE